MRVLDAIVTANEELRTTTLLITHNADIAQMGDRVVRFADGMHPQHRDQRARGMRPGDLRLVMRHLATLDRKLLRDLSRMKMQAAAVAAVLACGISLFVMATGMYGSLERARDGYYDSGRMADMAAASCAHRWAWRATLRRCPACVRSRRGFQASACWTCRGASEPVSARLVSLPPDRAPRVNDIVLREGKLPDPARSGEVLVNEAFAEANHLAVGSTMGALIYGKRRDVEIVGIASSPEFVFAVAPGALLPEPERFGVVWMGREALGRAFDLDGAFNDVVAAA